MRLPGFFLVLKGVVKKILYDSWAIIILDITVGYHNCRIAGDIGHSLWIFRWKLKMAC